MSFETKVAKKEVQQSYDPELQKLRETKRAALESDVVIPGKRELRSAVEMSRAVEGLSLRDLTDGERQKLKSIGMTDANIDKCKVDEKGVFHLKCLNCNLEGKRHPVTEVLYERRQISINGVKMEGVFPKFESMVEFQLPQDKLRASEKMQFEYLNKQLKEAINTNSDLRAKFTEQQIEMIERGFNPAGYTWHHNESLGRMQLVETRKHAPSTHTGGDSIWGGR